MNRDWDTGCNQPLSRALPEPAPDSSCAMAGGAALDRGAQGGQERNRFFPVGFCFMWMPSRTRVGSLAGVGCWTEQPMSS